MAGNELRVPPGARTIHGADLGKSIGISHLSWKFDPITPRALKGVVTSRGVGPLRISWIRLVLGPDPWSGERTDAEIAAVPEPYLTVVMPLDGAITITSPSRSVLIRKHELGIWDSTQCMEFYIQDARYEQISVLIPQRVLRAQPEACAALHCACIDERNVLSELCVKHMSTLAEFLNSELRPYEISLSTVTTSLVDAVIASVYKAPRDRDVLVAEIKNHIECYLTDDTLSPTSIAAAFDISTRYIHKLFEHEGCSIGEWILNRRLDRSADDLRQPDTSITTTAFKWGFKDVGHYSRTFKKRFGEPPSTYRRNGCEAPTKHSS